MLSAVAQSSFIMLLMLLSFFFVFFVVVVAGNWDPKTQEKRYSAKIPTKALRVMAGFLQDEGHWNPRTMVEPPEDLLRMIFPFIEEELAKLVESDDNHVTAMATLKFWQYLRKVIIQDAAVMFLDHGNDRKHHVLWRLPVFKCDAFKVSKRLGFVIFYFIFLTLFFLSLRPLLRL